MVGRWSCLKHNSQLLNNQMCKATWTSIKTPLTSSDWFTQNLLKQLMKILKIPSFYTEFYLCIIIIMIIWYIDIFTDYIRIYVISTYISCSYSVVHGAVLPLPASCLYWAGQAVCRRSEHGQETDWSLDLLLSLHITPLPRPQSRPSLIHTTGNYRSCCDCWRKSLNLLVF